VLQKEIACFVMPQTALEELIAPHLMFEDTISTGRKGLYTLLLAQGIAIRMRNMKAEPGIHHRHCNASEYHLRSVASTAA